MYRSKLKQKVIRNLLKGHTVMFDDLVFRNKNGVITKQYGYNSVCEIKKEHLDYFISVDHLYDEDVRIFKN